MEHTPKTADIPSAIQLCSKVIVLCLNHVGAVSSPQKEVIRLEATLRRLRSILERIEKLRTDLEIRRLDFRELEERITDCVSRIEHIYHQLEQENRKRVTLAGLLYPEWRLSREELGHAMMNLETTMAWLSVGVRDMLNIHQCRRDAEEDCLVTGSNQAVDRSHARWTLPAALTNGGRIPSAWSPAAGAIMTEPRKRGVILRRSQNFQNEGLQLSPLSDCCETPSHFWDACMQLLPSYFTTIERADECKVCRRFWTTVEGQLKECAETAARGCTHCQLIMHIAKHCFQEDTDAFRSHKRPLSFSVDEINVALNDQPFAVLTLRKPMAQLVDRHHVRVDVRFDLDGDTSWKPIRNGSLSKSAWYLVKAWLENCIAGHLRCRSPHLQYVPRRLLQINLGNDLVRLVESDEIATGGLRYAALSYCWGAVSDTFRTIRGNYSRNLHRVELKVLPLTVQDAIIFCNFLGMEYLWVDALCIVQDDIDLEDWYQQSADMCDIYSNAHFVLAVDASPHSKHGFLPGRNLFDECESFEAKNELKASFLKDTGSSIRFDGKTWGHGNPYVAPLSQRGWAMQESILGQRIIHVTTSGFEWECNEEQSTRMTHLARSIRLYRMLGEDPEVGSRVRSPKYDEYVGRKVHDITDIFGEVSPFTVYYSWQGIVEGFTGRRLTNQADKLNAISGLAKLVARSLGVDRDQYLAGLWREDLSQALLWYVTEGKMFNRARAYRAPSWSWASIDGPVGYFSERYQFRWRSEIVVEEACCKTTSSDPFGRITGGYLRLSSLLTPVELKIRPRVETTQSDYWKILAGRAHPYVNEVVSVRAREQSGEYEILLDEQATPEATYSTMSVYCLNMGEYSDGWRGQLWDSHTGGFRNWWLVLRKGDKSFTRIGIGFFDVVQRDFDLFDAATLSEIFLE